MKTTGAAAKIALQPDRNLINADGTDLSFVTVTIADKEGLQVSRANNLLKFEISGPAEIIATDNGDATNFESFLAKEHKAYNGLALVIIRSKAGKSGVVTLKVVSEGLQDAVATITTK